MNELAIRTPGIIAAEINQIKDDTRRVVLNNSVEIGRRLTEAKELVQHGEWEAWLREVEYSSSTANNLMRIFEEFGADQQNLLGDNLKSQTFGNISYSQAILLLGVPEEEREKFVIDNNVEEMSTRDLKKAIADLKKSEEEKEAALKAKEEIEKAMNELERVFNDGAEARRQLEADKVKLEQERNVLEDKIVDLQRLDSEIKISDEAANEKIEKEIEELRGKCKTLEEEREKLQTKIDMGKEGKSELEGKYKGIFKGLVTGFNEILQVVNDMEDESEVLAIKYTNGTKDFLGKMLERL